jgi:large subunit ribosomal protein L7A
MALLAFLGFVCHGGFFCMVHELSGQQRVAGLKQVMRCAREAALDKVYIAKDADEDIIEKLKAECDKHRIAYDMSLTMHQIGTACEIEVGSACAGVLKQGK